MRCSGPPKPTDLPALAGFSTDNSDLCAGGCDGVD
jgi:hypothetical protein